MRGIAPNPIDSGAALTAWPFLPQVRFLEQQNKMLETKWSFLKDETVSRSSIEPMYEAFIANLRKQLDGLGNERTMLETELNKMQGEVVDFRNK